MARLYWGVSPAFWTDEKVMGTDGTEPWGDDTKMLALYLLTCQHRTLEGLFRLPKGYITEDLRWSPERLAEPFAQLLQDGFIEYDERAQLCLIVNALEYHAPDNPNQITAGLRQLEDLPKSSLFSRLFQQAERFCQPLAERLQEQLPERLGKHLSLSPPLSPPLSPKGQTGAKAEFDKFWSLYPRRESKGHAQTAFAAAAKKTSPAVIIAGLEQQLPGLLARERQFIPLPATWLRGRRWEDEIPVAATSPPQTDRAKRLAQLRDIPPEAREAFCRQHGWGDVWKEVADG